MLGTNLETLAYAVRGGHGGILGEETQLSVCTDHLSCAETHQSEQKIGWN